MAAVWAAEGQRVGRGGEGLDLVRAMDERLGPSMATMAKLTSASMATAGQRARGRGRGGTDIYTHMQHAQIEILIVCLLQEITGCDYCIREQMAMRHKFRCPLDQAVIERPHELRMRLAELQRAEMKQKSVEQH